MRHDERLRWLVAVLLCAAVAHADERETPDVEFFEYLGGLVQEDEAWVGPDDMAVAPEDEFEAATSDSTERSDVRKEELQ